MQVIIIIIILLVLWGLWTLITRMRVNRIAKFLSQNDFEAGKRKAQIIDLREEKTFKAGHILGARNMPYSTLRTFYSGIRNDLPVYLYDQGKAISMRAALLLHKKGYHKLFILKDGYRNWDGKTKKN
ncbi:sulfurtransferase [Philodulcilactobacillus myokoensis]|uniref:Sulfurtransferase n=1 Tax=Philodulcilactobacillus myokoensis TaxID=2929573 RepID=A0A9W6B1H7_9LACO|nr:rhodanese-like domain-containing protein [Philodulcilactobacillus myokoensis]GLB46785.1 sulfurtransferase [Philodulcilactobacillus myokoensis]